MWAISSLFEKLRQKSRRRSLRCTHQKGTVEQEIHLLATCLRKKHARMAGSEIQGIHARGVGLDAQRIRGAPGGACYCLEERCCQPVGACLPDNAAEASRRIGRGRIDQETSNA